MENINRPEIYYSIVNIVDYIANVDMDSNNRSELYRILDKLLRIESDRAGEDINDTFNAIADANDVSGVKSWQEMVEAFKELFAKGERV